MQIKVLRPFYHLGAVVKAGEVLDVTPVAAFELVSNGKAERVEAAPPVKGPMTTESAPEIVQGKAPKAKKEDK